MSYTIIYLPSVSKVFCRVKSLIRSRVQIFTNVKSGSTCINNAYGLRWRESDAKHSVLQPSDIIICLHWLEKSIVRTTLLMDDYINPCFLSSYRKQEWKIIILTIVCRTSIWNALFCGSSVYFFWRKSPRKDKDSLNPIWDVIQL